MVEPTAKAFIQKEKAWFGHLREDIKTTCEGGTESDL